MVCRLKPNQKALNSAKRDCKEKYSSFSLCLLGGDVVWSSSDTLTFYFMRDELRKKLFVFYFMLNSSYLFLDYLIFIVLWKFGATFRRGETAELSIMKLSSSSLNFDVLQHNREPWTI